MYIAKDCFIFTFRLSMCQQVWDNFMTTVELTIDPQKIQKTNTIQTNLIINDTISRQKKNNVLC